MLPRQSQSAERPFRLAIAIVAAVTLIRCAVLVFSPLNLYPDEAQYWWWAQSPDFGYFSKPPMIAWIIWLSTALLGQAEWAIRIPSPLIHAGTALLVFAIARRVIDSRLSALAAIAYLTLPGVSYSSGLISTDVPLLLFWAAALYAFLRACEERDWRWSIICGVALGLGLQSKYAMLYFLAGGAIAALLVPAARRFAFSARGLAVLAIGLLLFAPNILWNARHGFPTLAHTEANADWTRSRHSLAAAASFLLGQSGVFGPILMAGWIAALWRLARSQSRPQTDLILAAFSLPPVLLILVQAFLAGANANWAATAYVAATPLAVAELARWRWGHALRASLLLNGAALPLLFVVLVRPDIADRIGIGNAFKREEGWRQLGAQVAQTSAAAPYNAIVADNRSVTAELLYYAHPRRIPVRIWARDLNIRDHFEMTIPLEPGSARALLAIEPANAGRVLATFDSAGLVKIIHLPVGGRHERVLELYDARHYHGPQIAGRGLRDSAAPVL